MRKKSALQEEDEMLGFFDKLICNDKSRDFKELIKDNQNYKAYEKDTPFNDLIVSAGCQKFFTLQEDFRMEPL